MSKAAQSSSVGWKEVDASSFSSLLFDFPPIQLQKVCLAIAGVLEEDSPATLNDSLNQLLHRFNPESWNETPATSGSRARRRPETDDVSLAIKLWDRLPFSSSILIWMQNLVKSYSVSQHPGLSFLSPFFFPNHRLVSFRSPPPVFPPSSTLLSASPYNACSGPHSLSPNRILLSLTNKPLPFQPPLAPRMDTQSTSCSPLSPSQSVSLPPLASFDFPPPAFSSNNERRPSSIFTGASSPSSSPLASPFSLPSWSPFHSATDAVDDSSPVISASVSSPFDDTSLNSFRNLGGSSSMGF